MLNNFKIGARLGIGFAATLIFLMTIAAIGVFRLQAVNSELNTLLKDRFPKTVMVNSINDNINVVARALRNMLLERTEDAQQKELARIVEARKVVSENVDKLDKTVASTEGRAILQLMKDRRTVFLILAQVRAPNNICPHLSPPAPNWRINPDPLKRAGYADR